VPGQERHLPAVLDNLLIPPRKAPNRKGKTDFVANLTTINVQTLKPARRIAFGDKIARVTVKTPAHADLGDTFEIQGSESASAKTLTE